MSKFGSDYPPGCSSTPFDDGDGICDRCGVDPVDCNCPPCDLCGVVGCTEHDEAAIAEAYAEEERREWSEAMRQVDRGEWMNDDGGIG